MHEDDSVSHVRDAKDADEMFSHIAKAQEEGKARLGTLSNREIFLRQQKLNRNYRAMEWVKNHTSAETNEAFTVSIMKAIRENGRGLLRLLPEPGLTIVCNFITTEAMRLGYNPRREHL